MRDFLREHGWAVVLSVLLHGLLVGGMLLATYISSQTHLPAVQPLPIDAVVVSSQVLHAVGAVVQEGMGVARSIARSPYHLVAVIDMPGVAVIATRKCAQVLQLARAIPEKGAPLPAAVRGVTANMA